MRTGYVEIAGGGFQDVNDGDTHEAIVSGNDAGVEGAALNQRQRDEASINKPDEPRRHDEEIEWDEDHYGWVSVDVAGDYMAWWDWEAEEWREMR